MLGQETPYHPLKADSSKEASKLTLCCNVEKTQCTSPHILAHRTQGVRESAWAKLDLAASKAHPGVTRLAQSARI